MLLYNNNNNISAKSIMTSLPARNTQNSYSDAVARNVVGRHCRHSAVKMSIDSAGRQCQSLVSAINVGLCVAGLTEFSHSVCRPTVAYGVYMVW